MTQPFTIAELDAIQAAAEAATPGPWHWINSINDKPRQPGEYQSSLRTVEEFPSFISKISPDHTLPKFILEAEDIEDANADFIATANPATVLRLVEQSRLMEWQPIETAPKDGTLIDVWEARHFSKWKNQDGSICDKGEWVEGRRHTEAAWYCGQEDFYGVVRDGWGHWLKVHAWVFVGPVTHWKPITSPTPEAK